MIEERRDFAFWSEVNAHPDVRAGLYGDDLRTALAHPNVRPFATEHGGWIFVQIDAVGRIFDVHAAYTPEGWGREAAICLAGCLEALPGWQLMTVLEVVENRRSRPPVTFGFRPLGDFDAGSRTWLLTRDAWINSHARRRMT